MLVSPAEPERFRNVPGYTTSSLPEKYGADFLFFTKHGKVGIQRKEVKDLLASIVDGRLAKEVSQLQTVESRVLIIEGRFQWSNDGDLVGNGFGQRWTHKQIRGLLWSVQHKDIWIETTEDIQDTITTLGWMEEWFKRDNHTSLDRRPGPVSMWGQPNNEDYQRHLIQGLPGVGYELAERIRVYFSGVPFGWNIKCADLEKIQGIGKKKAKMIYETLNKMGD